MELFNVWLQFIILTVLIVISGINLAKYADFIAAHTKLGRLWIGVVLLAIATSLPELINGISASIRGLPDIAVGNIFGACVLNLLQIAIIDIYYKPAPVLKEADKAHLISAGFGVLLFFIAGYFLIIEKLGFLALNIYSIGIYSPLLILGYIVAVRSIYLFQKKRVSKTIEEIAKPLHITLFNAYVLFFAFATVIIISGTFLPPIGVRLAELTGWSKSFVGTLLLAVSTSLPELTVSISAIRIGAIDLALGNILGSNLINLSIIGIDDFFFASGPILKAVSNTNLLTIFAAIGMYSAVTISIIYESKVKKMRVTTTALTLAGIFLLNTIFLFYA